MLGQEIPAGELVTDPTPAPAFVTPTVNDFNANVAVTALAPSTEIVHDPVPEQLPPDQPANEELASGAAVSVTVAPRSNSLLQDEPQAIPAGLDETVPLPFPARETSTGLTVWHDGKRKRPIRVRQLDGLEPAG